MGVIGKIIDLAEGGQVHDEVKDFRKRVARVE